MAESINLFGDQRDVNQAFGKWKTDPRQFTANAVASDPKLRSVQMKPISERNPVLLQAGWGCWLCQKAVEKTLEGILGVALAAIVGAVIASDGADVPAVPEEVELASVAAAEAVAVEAGVSVTEATAVLTESVETGLAWIVANKVKAVGMFLAGELLGDVFFEPAAQKLCNLGGHCPT
jgi:hypothetical protein